MRAPRGAHRSLGGMSGSMSAADRRTVLLLLGLAVAGQGVRTWLGRSAEAPGQLELLGAGPGGPAGDGVPSAHRDSAVRAERPLGPGETVDLDRAPVRDLTRLPRVGTGLARRIVADREARGPFGSLEGLDRVPGVGPGLLAQIAPHAAFSSGGRPAASGRAGAEARLTGASGRREIVWGEPPRSPVGISNANPRIDLNTADAAALDRLPGIGPAKARAIVEYRTAHGPFGSPEALAGVPGISPALARRLWDASGRGM